MSSPRRLTTGVAAGYVRPVLKPLLSMTPVRGLGISTGGWALDASSTNGACVLAQRAVLDPHANRHQCGEQQRPERPGDRGASQQRDAHQFADHASVVGMTEVAIRSARDER